MVVTIGSVGVYVYETTLDREDDSEYRKHAQNGILID